MTRIATALVIVIVGLSGAPTAAAQDIRDDVAPPKIIIAIPPTPASRPGVLPPLYVGLVALQAYDGYSTIRGVREGASETNALVGGLAAHPVAFWSIKAASTFTTIYIAERLWREHHRGQAIVTMIVANGAMAAVAARNAWVLSSRR